MTRAFLIWPLALVFSAFTAFADARLTVLVDVLKLHEAAQILSDEGMNQAQDLNKDMLGGQGGTGFQEQVARIYAPERMAEQVRAALAEQLQGEELEAVITFYASALGQKIISLENAARIAIQDPTVEEAARGGYLEMLAWDDSRLKTIERYVLSGDMLNRNVTGAMNASYQFLRGLSDGGAIEMSEEEMLSDATRDFEGTVQETTEWLYSYLLMAYHSLDDEDLGKLVAFAETPAGKDLNNALFIGFAKAFEDISYALGRAVALNMSAQEL